MSLRQETASIIDMAANSRIAVRMLGMLNPAHCNNRRIDLDRVDVVCTAPQRRRHIITGTGAENCYLMRIRTDLIGNVVCLEFWRFAQFWMLLQEWFREIYGSLKCIPVHDKRSA